MADAAALPDDETIIHIDATCQPDRELEVKIAEAETNSTRIHFACRFALLLHENKAHQQLTSRLLLAENHQ